MADGVFHAELHAFFERSISSAGYAGFEVRVTPVKTEIRIKATKTQEVVGVEGRKIRELTSLIQKRFNYKKDGVEVYVERVQHRGLCAAAQAESVKAKLLAGVPVRMAANSVTRAVMGEGAKGVEVVVSGKLRQQRAKSMKFKSGYMICTGQPKIDFVDVSIRHVFFKQGIMGVKVKIMLPHDPTGRKGVKTLLPDTVTIHDPKQDNDEGEIKYQDPAEQA